MRYWRWILYTSSFFEGWVTAAKKCCNHVTIMWNDGRLAFICRITTGAARLLSAPRRVSQSSHRDVKQTEADCTRNCKNRFLFHLDSSQLVDYWQVFTQGFNAETVHTRTHTHTHTHTHTLPPLCACVCVWNIRSMCAWHVCSCISECEIRLNSGRGAVDGGWRGELQVLCYARFTPRYVGASVCV